MLVESDKEQRADPLFRLHVKFLINALKTDARLDNGKITFDGEEEK